MLWDRADVTVNYSLPRNTRPHLGLVGSKLSAAFSAVRLRRAVNVHQLLIGRSRSCECSAACRKTTCHNTERNRTSLDMSSPRNNQADFSGICFSDATEPFTSKCCCVLLELNVSSSLVSRLQGSGRISVKQCFHNVCKCLFTEPRGRSNPPRDNGIKALTVTVLTVSA